MNKYVLVAVFLVLVAPGVQATTTAVSTWGGTSVSSTSSNGQSTTTTTVIQKGQPVSHNTTPTNSGHAWVSVFAHNP